MTGNVNYQADINCGYIDAGFSQTDYIFEDTYKSQKVDPLSQFLKFE